MSRRIPTLATALIGVGLIGANVLPSAAQQPPPPIATELLTGRAVLTDDVDLKLKIKFDGHSTRVVKAKHPSRTLVARFTVQPGAQFPWHSHAGPVIVNVTRGELVYVDGDDCVERRYQAEQRSSTPVTVTPTRLQRHQRGDGHRGHLLRGTGARTAAHPCTGACELLNLNHRPVTAGRHRGGAIRGSMLSSHAVAGLR